MSIPEPLRTPIAALGVLLVGVVPVALYAGQQLAARRLGHALSRGIGLPVSVDAFWAGSGPSVVIAGLTVGGDRPILHVDRTIVDFELRPSLRPRPWRVRLIRPALHVTDRRLWRWLAEQRTPAAPRPHRRAIFSTAPGRRSVEISIEDGALRIEHRWHGRRMLLRSSGIALRPGTPARLLLGPTEISADGERLFEAAASAIELERARGWRPVRAALLGGTLRPPGGAPLTLHTASISAETGGYRVQAIARPAGQDPGRIVCHGRLDSRLRPSGPAGLELAFHRVALGRLAAALPSRGLRLQQSRLSGQARLHLDQGRYRIEAALRVDELEIQRPYIARRPVGPFGLELRGTAMLDPGLRRIHVEDLRLGTGGVSLAVRGEADFEGGHTRLSVDARLPPSSCQRTLAALPPGLAPALAGMAVDGQLGGRARLRLDTRDLAATEADLVADPLGCKVVSDPPRADVRKLLGPMVIRVAGARDLQLGPSNPDWHPLGRISRSLRQAFVVAEDSQFWNHRGFDARQLRRAFIENLKEGRLSRGASTISQQLIKNVYLGQERTLARKLQEAVLTWRLEQVIPKRRILELYLNLVEMGPDVYGVGQAARTYFKEDAALLGPTRAAQLAALTPSPRNLAPRLREGKCGQAMGERVQLLLRLMKRRDAGTQPPAPPPDGERVSLRQDAEENLK